VAVAQNWHPPVGPPLRLSGSFGELRTSHFHTGIDIKSKNGTVGDKIYAAEEGFISRIRVHPASYGNVLYIDHPSGHTTLYAHLNDFMPEIARWVRDKQYELESFEIDVKLDSNVIKVERGQQIGWMGNSGYSFGPHLHFEVRNTKTERAISPVSMGFDIKDEISPTFRFLHVYPTSEEGELLKNKAYTCYNRGAYKLNIDTLMVDSRVVGLGIEIRDKMNATPNQNGIHALNMYVDDQLVFSFAIDSLEFGKGGYLNAHTDYAYRYETRRKVHRCFRLPGNELDIYTEADNAGLIALDDSKAKKVRIVAADVVGNESELITFLKWTGQTKRSDSRPMYRLQYDEPNRILIDGVEFETEAYSFYENIPLDMEVFIDKSDGIFSPVVQVGNKNIPMHRASKLKIPVDRIPEHLRSKAFLAKCDMERNIQIDGQWQDDGYLLCQITAFGAYCVKIDTLAPTITPISTPSTVSSSTVWKWKAVDGYKHVSGSDGLIFEGRIDGNWVLVTYDYKNDLFSCPFDMDLETGEHEFVLKISDRYNNESEFRKKFTYR
jgi:hypothetical protein